MCPLPFAPSCSLLLPLALSSCLSVCLSISNELNRAFFFGIYFLSTAASGASRTGQYKRRLGGEKVIEYIGAVCWFAPEGSFGARDMLTAA